MPIKQDREIIDKIKQFVTNYEGDHATNVADFKISKNFAAGNGFKSEVYGSWDKNRAKTSVNIMEPIVNSVVYKFTESPFDFKIKGIDESQQLPINIDFTELKFQLGTALRDAITDGISYIQTYKKGDKIGFKRLNNFNVMFSESDYSNGKDVKEVIYVDKRETGKKERRSEMSIAFTKVLDLKETEIPVITYWYMIKDDKTGNSVVHTVKLERDEVVEKSVQELQNIPITRIYGKEVPIDFKKNWRGLYYLVKDILRTIDFNASLITERLACAPTFQWWIAEESLGTNIESLAKAGDAPTSFKTYRAYNPHAPQIALPLPQRADMSCGLEELLANHQVHINMISAILGMVAGEEKGNETAEAVLLRRETKDTASNDLIRNLLDSCHQIAEVIKDFTALEVDVMSDLFDKAKKNDDLQKIIALTQFLNANPQAQAITPVLISKMDVDEVSKNTMLALLEQDKEGQSQQQQEIEMLKMENQQLHANAEAQMQTAQMQHQSKIAEAEMNYAIKIEEFKLKWAELHQKAAEAGIKLNIEGKDSDRQESNDEKRLELEAAKFAADQIRGK